MQVRTVEDLLTAIDQYNVGDPCQSGSRSRLPTSGGGVRHWVVCVLDMFVREGSGRSHQRWGRSESALQGTHSTRWDRLRLIAAALPSGTALFRLSVLRQGRAVRVRVHLGERPAA